MARIAVAATAPFGADVLEQLAARHEISALLTRPDARQGRGRRVAPPPAKVVAERLGCPVLQPDRPERGLDLGAPVVVVCAYGLLIPEELLAERSWLNVHPSLLPRWRGAAPVERAILAGDTETGVTIHETVKELDAGPDRRPGGVPDRPTTTPARCSSARRPSPCSCSTSVLADPSPSFVPQSAEGVTYADKIEPADRVLDLDAPGRRARAARARAVAAHRRARRVARPPGDGLAGAGGRDGCVRADRGSARRRQADGRGGLAARASVSAASISPARAAAFEVIRRVFEDEAYADRALRTAAAKPRRARPRTRAAARVRHGAAHADARLRDRDDRPSSRAAPRRRLSARRCGSARSSSPSWTACRGTRRSTSPSSSCAGRGSSGRFPSRTLSCAGSPTRAELCVEALPESTWQEAALRHSYPDWVAETWWRDLGAEGALALMRAQNEAPPTVVRLVRGEIDGVPDADVPGAWHVEHVDEGALAEGRVWPQSVGSQLAGLCVGSVAGERVLDLCAAPGGKATMLAGDVVAVEANEARARELEVNVRRLGATNVEVVCADGRELPPELTGFDRALVDAPCSGLGVLAARPDLRWRSQPLPELQLELLQRCRGSRAPRRAPSCTPSAPSTATRPRRSSTPRGSRSTRRSPKRGRSSATRPRPEFLQTLPHVHGTSGFFIARLRVVSQPL